MLTTQEASQSIVENRNGSSNTGSLLIQQNGRASTQSSKMEFATSPTADPGKSEAAERDNRTSSVRTGTEVKRDELIERQISDPEGFLNTVH